MAGRLGDRLENKVALITGGARGMGAAHARRFVAEGAKVAVTDVLDTEGEGLVKELGEAAAFFTHDVTSAQSWSEVVDGVKSALGGIDVLVNNAGIFAMAPVASMPVDDYLRVVMVNQVGVFLGMQAVVAAMIERGGGSIVNISSIDGLRGSPLSVAYVASKFAVCGMTKVAAMELAGAGIRVNSVHPGGVRTPMLEDAGIDVDAALTASVPLRRFAEPEEVSNLVLFLASDESSYCTGAEFVIDGGLTTGIGAELLNLGS